MICAVVLAAGRSVRMGTQKLLLELGGQTVITRIVDELLLSPIQRVVVVVGRDADRIQAAVAGRNVGFVTNPDFVGDMLSSVRCGLRALPRECEAALVALGDQPGVSSELVEQMIKGFRETQRGIIVPSHNGKRGHPLLFSARFREEVLTSFDGEGLLGLLKAHPDAIHEIPGCGAEAIEDMDTPADYERERQRVR